MDCVFSPKFTTVLHIYLVHPRAACTCLSLQFLVASKVTGEGRPWTVQWSTSTFERHLNLSSLTSLAPGIEHMDATETKHEISKAWWWKTRKDTKTRNTLDANRNMEVFLEHRILFICTNWKRNLQDGSMVCNAAQSWPKIKQRLAFELHLLPFRMGKVHCNRLGKYICSCRF